MAKTKITYNGESERITWHGQAFEKGRAIETDNEALIAAARRNSFFATAGLADKQTKAGIEAEENARKEAEERAKAEEEEEARRVLEINAGEPLEGDEPDQSVPRRGRPPKNA